MGKQLRMRRIFPNGKALVLPLDHPIYFGPQPGVEDPAKLLALARDHGATAVLLTAGALRSAVHEVGDLGIILRIDATLSQMGGPDTIMHLLHTPEEAAALGADMVVVNCYLGIADAKVESALLAKLATVSAQCESIGMPLCGEIIPRVSYADPAQTTPTSADLALAIRLGLEYGCDVVKTVYNGDPEGYAKAVASGHLPVIMAGGPKSSNETAIFHQLHEAMTHGASGAAIGRRVWGSAQPAAMLDAIRAIVIDGVSAKEAIRRTESNRLQR
jgi:DhnA family fructose-bisphosphate aldolase class Ia